MMAAFMGEPVLREELAADIEAGGDKLKQWLGKISDPKGYSAFGEDIGLHLAFTSLVSGLAADLTKPEAKAFAAAVARQLPVGANSVDAVRAWCVRTWSSDAMGLERNLSGSDALAPARQVIALIQQSRTEPVGGKVFRTARAALAGADASAETAADYVSVVLAMAWDFEQVPGAATDVLSAWARSIAEQAWRQSGWTKPLREELGKLEHEIHEQTIGLVDMSDQSDPQKLRAAYTAQREKIVAANPRVGELQALAQKSYKVSAEAQLDWLGKARLELLAVLEETGRVN